MIPYKKYLYCLHLIHKNNEDKIVSDLNKYGLPSNRKVIDYSIDQFFRMLGKYSKALSLCLYMDFSENAFIDISHILEVNSFFNKKLLCEDIFNIVSDPLIKRHVECCLISNIDQEIIIKDIKNLYHKDITIEDIVKFRILFFNIDYISNTNDFIKYVDMLSPEEKAMKNKCRANGSDYTRWALGASVELDSKKITKEMITDVYFRYKEKSTDRSMDAFDKAIKLGNLATKLIDREMKLKASTVPDNSDMEEQFGKQLCLFDFEDDNPKLAGDINNVS